MFDFCSCIAPKDIKAGKGDPIVVYYPIKYEFVPHCLCKPKLYHWSDPSNPFVHGYFWGCEEHGISTQRHTNLEGVDNLKKEWYEGKVVKDHYIEDSYEVNQ